MNDKELIDYLLYNDESKIRQKIALYIKNKNNIINNNLNSLDIYLNCIEHNKLSILDLIFKTQNNINININNENNKNILQIYILEYYSYYEKLEDALDIIKLLDKYNFN